MTREEAAKKAGELVGKWALQVPANWNGMVATIAAALHEAAHAPPCLPGAELTRERLTTFRDGWKGLEIAATEVQDLLAHVDYLEGVIALMQRDSTAFDAGREAGRSEAPRKVWVVVCEEDYSADRFCGLFVSEEAAKDYVIADADKICGTGHAANWQKDGEVLELKLERRRIHYTWRVFAGRIEVST